MSPKAAVSEIEIALGLSPDDPDVNSWAGVIYMFAQDLPKAISCWEKATIAVDASFWTLRMLGWAYSNGGKPELAQHVARRVIDQTHAVLAADPDNGPAMGALAEAHAILGDKARAHETAELGVLLNPDNFGLNTCLVSAFVLIGDFDHALDALERLLRRPTRQVIGLYKHRVEWLKLREHPRFENLMLAAEAQLAGAN